MNQKIMYNLMFRSVSETLVELSANPKHLGARIGFMGVLHLWGQNLMNIPISTVLLPTEDYHWTVIAECRVVKGSSSQ